MTESSAAGRRRPVVLCVLDGWGERAETANNAIALGETPNWDRFVTTCPVARLDASGPAVGLPEGQMGNSEVGHMTIGAGRAILQVLPRIDAAVADGTLAANPVLGDLIEGLRASGGTCHLMGLLSPGGVHAHQDHMAALVGIAAAAGLPVAVHAFLDGRDTQPKSAARYMTAFLAAMATIPNAAVATVSGRYYAMDRDRRWDRVEPAYRALTEGRGERAADPVGAIERSYAAQVTDEFVVPTVVGDYAGMRDGDGIVIANFRADRVRQILGALCDPDFDAFPRPRPIAFAARVGMTQYSIELNRFLAVLFPSQEPECVLGQVVSDAAMSQLRIAETEKYAHVTFFLNGGRESLFPGEERILVPSPKVTTYDLKPEMSAPELTDRLVEAVRSDAFDLIVVNYANGDMVGHTGCLEAAIKAVETVDACLGRLEATVVEAGGALLVTADHGNCELMVDGESGHEHTAHSLNPVPAVLINGPAWTGRLRDGALADVAPTVLRLLGLPRPEVMTGRPLTEEGGARTAAAQ